MPFPLRLIMTARIPAWFVGLLAVCSVVGHAQDTLTLDRCIVLAKENSPRSRLAANAVRTAELSLAELGKSQLPQMTGVAGATYTPVPPKLGYDPAITDGGQVAGQVVVRQSLYDGGIRGVKSDQLQLDLERTVRERELSERELIFAVRQSYSEVLRAQDEVDLRRENLAKLVSYGELVRRLYNGGTVNYADLLKSEMQTSAATLALEKSQESVESARLSLAEVIGTPVTAAVQLNHPPIDVPSVPSETVDLSRNLELIIARLKMQKGDLDIQLTSHERFPVLALVADAGYLSSGDNLRLSRHDRLNTLGYSIGVSLEIPIFNWGAAGLRVEQKELAAEDLRLQVELLRRSLSTEILKATLQLTKARGRLLTLRETIRKAEENFLLTKAKYAAGGTLALEVFVAQQLLTDTKMDELQTSADIRNLTARLERLTANDQTRQ